MLVKSTVETDYIRDLEETSGVLCSYQIKLNPQKCVFGVGSGKFLGFMITNRGIEANPEKIQVICDMKEPTTLNSIQKLNGRLAALSKFLSRGAERALPFLKLLRGVTTTKKVTTKKRIVWDEDCRKAFQELKECLENIPLLTRPMPKDVLLLYMAV